MKLSQILFSLLITLIMLNNSSPRADALPIAETARPAYEQSQRSAHMGQSGREAELARRQALETQILAATVFIEMSGWLKSDVGTFSRLTETSGHATIMNGRYLVTHNHYSLPVDALSAGMVIGLVSLRRTNGDLILHKAPLHSFRIALAEAQTLVLAFETPEGDGLFDMLGLPSAEFRHWRSLPLEPGTTVAQIDWDGQRSFVEWVTVEQVILDEGTPRAELGHYLEMGASGGGVFWNGYHIANNWRRTKRVDANGATSRLFSTAALNPPSLVELNIDAALTLR